MDMNTLLLVGNSWSLDATQWEITVATCEGHWRQCGDVSTLQDIHHLWHCQPPALGRETNEVCVLVHHLRHQAGKPSMYSTYYII